MMNRIPNAFTRSRYILPPRSYVDAYLHRQQFKQIQVSKFPSNASRSREEGMLVFGYGCRRLIEKWKLSLQTSYGAVREKCMRWQHRAKFSVAIQRYAIYRVLLVLKWSVLPRVRTFTLCSRKEHTKLGPKRLSKFFHWHADSSVNCVHAMKISPDLKHVVALPCEIRYLHVWSRYCYDQRLSDADCHT